MIEPRPVYEVADNGSDPGARIPLRITAQIHWLLLQLMEHGNGDLKITVRGPEGGGKIILLVPSPMEKPWTEAAEDIGELIEECREWIRIEKERNLRLR